MLDEKDIEVNIVEKGSYYHAVINDTDENGRRKQAWRTTGLLIKDYPRGKSKNGEKGRVPKIVRDKGKELKKEYATSRNGQNDITLIICLYQWLDSKSRSIEQNTYDDYLATIEKIEKLGKQYFPKIELPITQLESQDFQKFYDSMFDNGISSYSIRKQHGRIHSALSKAVSDGLILYNLVSDKRVVLPKVEKPLHNFYSIEQLNTLLNEICGDEMASLILFTAIYGLRRSECLGLKWKHISTDSFEIRDVVVKVKGNKALDKPRTKNRTSHRTLPLTKETKLLLQELKQQQSESKKQFGNTYIENDYVFKRKNGEPFTPNQVSKHFKALLKRHNLPDIDFHELRHSSASMLLSNKFDLKRIQEWLGHSNIATTADTYAHLQYHAKQDMAETLGTQIKIETVRNSVRNEENTP